MKRTLIWLTLMLIVSPAHAELNWASLWSTADQRASQLLNQGDAHNAARTYTDLRHKAFAEFQAGEYADAARDFAQFDDSDTHYNRGNALAHQGDLNAALQAYDTALAKDPHNEDARHNRELVVQALLQQKKQNAGQGDSKKSQQGKNGNKNDSNSSSQQGAKGSESDSKSKDTSNRDGKGDTKGESKSATQQGSQGSQKSQKKATEQGQDLNNSDQTAAGSKGVQPKDVQPKDVQPKASNQNPNAASLEANNKQQAMRDAAAALGQSPNGQNRQGQNQNPGGAKAQESLMDKLAGAIGAGNMNDQPTTQLPQTKTSAKEQPLSREQWLDRIPDDPGGLLRRKLLIEHMMRQRQVQP